MQDPNQTAVMVSFAASQNATKEELMAIQKVADAVKEANAVGLTVMVTLSFRQPLAMSSYDQNIEVYRKNVR